MARSRTPSRRLVNENGNVHQADFRQRSNCKLQFKGHDRRDERSAYHWKNINQLAKKANEINSIYAKDYENFKKEYEKICRTLNQSAFIKQPTVA